MDTPKPPQKPAHLLDDLESIRQLLGDDNLQPPLLTDTVVHEPVHDEQIPCCSTRSTASRNPSLLPRPKPKGPTPCCTWTANCALPRS